VQRLAPAKINLFLHVGDRRADGYHDLFSLVVFASIGDIIRAVPAPETRLRVSGPHAAGLDAGPSNLVLKAEAALRQWAQARGHVVGHVDFDLEKNLPVASGIGGGSSDAAAALHLLAALWGLSVPPDELVRIGRSLGADVPVCLRADATIMSGDGEHLAPAPELPDFAMVLVNPRVAVPTPTVFADLKVRTGAHALALPQRFASVRELMVFLDRTANDLASPAKRIAPAIMRVEQALVATPDCLLARMSGSGATCFGIYPDAAAAGRAAAALRARHPDWWIAEAALWPPSKPG
jgi:4-diphosphocytidyl-2-C-methyl-D-erythritol kinase